MAPDAPILELRVHGVGNTSAAELLDLPAEALERVGGDAVGSFWRPKDPTHAPVGSVREAYSWGGMVRAVPVLGGGPARLVTSAITRIVYALLLPFSLTTVAQWTWQQPTAGDTERGTRRFASAVRLFGLLLTLLFTCTVATLALDVGALQCAATPTPCTSVAWLFSPAADWTQGQRLSLAVWIPVLAIGVLWLISTYATVRFDLQPTRGSVPAGTLLGTPGFWASRLTGDLAGAHVAAAVAGIAALVSVHAAVTWNTDCRGLDPGCLLDVEQTDSFRLFASMAVAGLLVLIAAGVRIALLPTTAVSAPVRPARWRLTVALLVSAAAVFVATVIALASSTGGTTAPARLYGGGATPLALVTVAALIAATAVAWRLRAGRRFAAWHGMAPAVTMTLALTLAITTSAIVLVAAANFANGEAGAAKLVRDDTAGIDSVSLSSSWVALATCALIGLLAAGFVVGARSIGRRDVSARAARWGAAVAERHVVVARSRAARLHVVEPALGTVATAGAIGLVAGIIWSWAAYVTGSSLWRVLPGIGAEAVRVTLDLAMPVLSISGVVFVLLLGLGATIRPLGIVWDIICALPRTGHPFGPPCYAQRAVPELADRVAGWLTDAPERRVVLAAHSMGGVLAVAALAMLTPAHAERTRLLTFGVQLRPLFGRVFPELFGPAVLGTAPVSAPRAGVADPWADDDGGPIDDAPMLDGPIAPAAVRWVNLWRLTDYLGFPAAGGALNAVDRYAEETDADGVVLTHSWYYRTPAYAVALADLSRR